MMPVDTSLSFPLARTLNVLADSSKQRRTVRWLSDHLGVGIEAIDPLARAGFVAGQTNGGDNVDLLGGPLTGLRHVLVVLSASGQRWVDWNPQNRAIRVLASTPRRWAVTVQKLMARADADADLVRQLADNGLIEVMDETGRRITSLAYGVFRFPESFTVCLTPAGRSVVKL